MTLGHGWLQNEVNENGKRQFCTAAAWNYLHDRMNLLERFAPQSDEYRRYFR